MKLCPTCQTRYDEEILRFCTKDGTPLIEEGKPNFVQMPSESLNSPDDDAGEETVIRRKPPIVAPPSAPALDDDFSDSNPRASKERIVIPTAGQLRDQQVRTRQTAAYQSPPQSNTVKVVVLTVLGTLVILAGAGTLFYLLRSDQAANKSVNVNINTNAPDTNLNTNLNIGTNYNFNSNANAANINANFNANVAASNANANATPKPSPTPTATPKPSPTPTATPRPDDDENNVNAAPPANVRPTATPAAPSNSNSNSAPSNRPVNAGLLNSRAVNLTTPAYPSAARTARAAGQVMVQIAVDESGNVLSAKAVSGHPLLRQPAEAAARQSRFNPVRVGGEAVKANGMIVYNFIGN